MENEFVEEIFIEDEDIYNEQVVADYADNDAISSKEAAFMMGYLNA